jgi:hypothetical protein
MTRLDGRGIGELRWFARWVAPVVTIGVAALVLLGAIRLARFPTPDRYTESLPVHATVPSPRGQPCTPIEHKRDPDHDPGWDWDKDQCATPDFDASPLSFHYHVLNISRDPDFKLYILQYRTRAGLDRSIGSFFGTEPPEVRVWRDDALDAWLVQGRGTQVRVISLNRPRWRVYLHDLRGRIAVPLGWWLVAAGGLLAALLCFGASSALGSLAAGGSEHRREWITARRGDLALGALAIATCTGALMAAALFAGFLT